MSSNSVYYGKLSEMLKKIILQRKIEAMSYEEYLRQVVELAEAILHPENSGSYPGLKTVQQGVLYTIILKRILS